MDSYKNSAWQCFCQLLSINLVRIKALAVILFTITAAIYFITTHSYTLPLYGKIFVKCSPILCLMWFVFLHITPVNERSSYSKKIFAGLLFSCLGDMFLVIDGMFIAGMAAFAIGHCNYIAALGFDELKLIYGCIVYAISIVVTPYILPSDQILQYCIPVYSLLLSTMGWRALAKLHNQGKTNWNRLLVGIGGILWIISDTTLAYNEFKHSFPYAKTIVMSTYYAGQLGIASSVMLDH